MWSGRCLAVTLGLVAIALPISSTAQSPLPGGAQSLREIYGNWQVICQGGGRQASAETTDVSEAAPVSGSPGKPLCVLAQTQLEQKSRRLVMSIELQLDAGAAGKLAGQVVLPFGLAVAEPLLVQSVGRTLQELRISTCLEVGCIAPLALSGAMQAALAANKPVTILFKDTDGRQTGLSLQPTGFSDGFARIQALMRP